jgi:3-(3-hydroxy-phenyl)propionate hydroxylase
MTDIPSNMNADFDTDVAVIGYGPTGLAASLKLAHHGIRVTAFEKERSIYPRARAVTVNDWTMRCFQSIGMDEALAKTMDPTAALRWVTYEGQELMRVQFPPSKFGRHPRSYAIYQPAMEEALRAASDRLTPALDVRYGMEVIEVQQDATGAELSVRDLGNGEVRRVRARYVLACDGGSSATRERLGIRLLGETVETKWVVIDARVKRWWPERHILTFWSDKNRPVVDIALAQGNHRWEFPLGAHESETDFDTQEKLWPLLRSLGVTEHDIDIHQHAFYKHHVRHAERWQAGRVFLLGDAAHLMPPWAGAGMQSGIRDAFNLGWKLVEVLQGRLPETVLGSYETERAPNVELMTQAAIQLGRIIRREITPPETPDSGQPMVEMPNRKDPTLDAGWVRGPISDEGIIGKMVPQPQVANAQGKLCLLDDVLGVGFALIGDGFDPAECLSAEEKADWDRLGARYLVLRSSKDKGRGSNDIIDLDGSLLQWMRDLGVRAIALRPDRFVAAADVHGLAVPDC